MAVRIAIVEDEKSAARALEQAIQRYGTENKVSFTIRVWHDPLLFLEEYQAEYDIVYMDIRMPALSGMETAESAEDGSHGHADFCDQPGAVCAGGVHGRRV